MTALEARVWAATGQAGVAEPLAELAALARQWAPVHCQADGEGRGCGAYHGFWPFMRLMGLGKTLSGQSARYLAELGAALTGHRQRHGAAPARVLVSGCADASALAHVLEAGRCSGVALAATVVDRCATPLRLCEWYARQQGVVIASVRQDLLAHHADGAYDLIFTSSLLGYFSPAQRVELFQRYACLLAPGGVLLFANRLRTGDEAQAVGFSAPQAEAFAAEAMQRSARLPPPAALTPAQAHAAALAYARGFRSYPLASVDTLQALARQAGLGCEIEAVATLPARAGDASGPTLADGAPYLFVRMRKPAGAGAGT